MGIYDSTGKEVDKLYFQGNKFTYVKSILSSGVYFFKIRDENIVVGSGKIIVE